jgi:hypothetical protein
MSSLIKTPKADSSAGGLKSSMLSFFKLDSIFGRSQERTVIKPIPKTEFNKNLKEQVIQSTKQVNQKNNYQTNLISEFSNEGLNDSIPLSEPMKSFTNSE